MDINRLTEKAQEALRAAQSEATRLGHQQIDVEHSVLSDVDGIEFLGSKRILNRNLGGSNVNNVHR